MCGGDASFLLLSSLMLVICVCMFSFRRCIVVCAWVEAHGRLCRRAYAIACVRACMCVCVRVRVCVCVCVCVGGVMRLFLLLSW